MASEIDERVGSVIQDLFDVSPDFAVLAAVELRKDLAEKGVCITWSTKEQ